MADIEKRFEGIQATVIANGLHENRKAISEYRVDPAITKSPEALRFRKSFTLEEKEKIEANRGLIYRLSGTDIGEQRAARAIKGLPAFSYPRATKEELIGARSQQIEVAIFPEPKDLFVPESFGKYLAVQEHMAHADSKRLGLPYVTQIIPDEVSTLTDLVFQHYDKTGVWLLGPDFAEAQNVWANFRHKIPGNVYAITKNFVDPFKSVTIDVGFDEIQQGLLLYSASVRADSASTGAIRMAVPTPLQ